MPSYEPVAALLRGLDVLRLLNEHGPQSIGELHAATGLAKPTLVRVIETLQHAGYVDAGDDDRRYRVTARVLTLANGYEAQKQLMAVATPLLQAAREEVGWPIELGVFDQDAMVILDTSRQPGVLSVNRKPGARVPVLKTALGRAYLAALPEDEFHALATRLAALPDADFDLARARGELDPLMQRARELGFGFSDRASVQNGRAVAAAIRVHGKPVGSVNILVHVSAMGMAQVEQTYGATVIDLARRIGAAMDR